MTTEPSTAPQEPQEEGMTMLEHLEELRQRIITSAIAFILGLIMSAVPLPPTWQTNVTWLVITAVVSPVGYENVQAIKPAEVFFTYFQVAMLIGLALAMPVILYQAMSFVLPALLPEEKKYFYMAVPGATLSFIVGIVFGYAFILPAAVQFLFNFGSGTIQQRWAFSEYAETATTLLFWMGLAFELPLSIFFLCKLRVLSVDKLVSFRKYALIGAFVIGALITPTPDPFNQTLVSLPLYLLFELGLLLARLA
jgi:sec-independent protein translocase protein TatC